MQEARLRALLLKLTVLLILGIVLVGAGVVWLLVINGQARGGLNGARFVYSVIAGVAG